jgi:hypothetical protein
VRNEDPGESKGENCAPTRQKKQRPTDRTNENKLQMAIHVAGVIDVAEAGRAFSQGLIAGAQL